MSDTPAVPPRPALSTVDDATPSMPSYVYSLTYRDRVEAMLPKDVLS